MDESITVIIVQIAAQLNLWKKIHCSKKNLAWHIRTHTCMHTYTTNARTHACTHNKYTHILTIQKCYCIIIKLFVWALLWSTT